MREESVSTSLKELLRLEEERQCKEGEEIVRRTEMERAEREAREHAAWEAEQEKKRRALAEEQESAAQRARAAKAAEEDAQARLRTMEKAEEEHRRAHERELARLHTGNAPRGIAIGVLAGTALTAALTAAGYVGFVQPQMARANEATLRIVEERASLRRQIAQGERALAEEGSKVATLQSELATARKNGERLERALETARGSPPSAPTPLVRPKETAPAPPPKAPDDTCHRGDPLCP